MDGRAGWQRGRPAGRNLRHRALGIRPRRRRHWRLAVGGSGLLGLNAYTGGKATAALGLLLHFFIAFVMALVYVRAGRRLPVLIAQPALMGALYGLVLFVVMNFIVIPLSAMGYHSPSLWGFWRALLPHVVLVGPVIALIAAGRTRRGSKPTS
jgi:hypothetical protein